MERGKEASARSNSGFFRVHCISCYDIMTKATWIGTRYNQRDEKAHFVGLPGAGGVPLPDPPFPPFQRASGKEGRIGTGPVPTAAEVQGHARVLASVNPRISQPHGFPPP